MGLASWTAQVGDFGERSVLGLANVQPVSFRSSQDFYRFLPIQDFTQILTNDVDSK